MATTTKPAAKKPKGKRNLPEIVDPRQLAFISGYQDPASPTFGNAFQSALAAGYSESYAKNITIQMPDAIVEKLGNDARVKKAEAHIDEVLDVPILVQAMGAFGPLFERIPTGKKNKKTGEEIYKRGKPIMVHSTSLMKEKSKIVEIVLPALKKNLYGKEHGGKVAFNFNINPSGGRERYAS